MTERRPHLLVAEDDAPIRTLVTRVLEKNGFTVTAANDGEEAIEAIARDVFDAVVLDLMMPRRNGIEVLDYLDRTHKGFAPRCVIVTTAASTRDLKLLEGHSVFRILRKPFDVGELVAALKQCTGTAAGAETD